MKNGVWFLIVLVASSMSYGFMAFSDEGKVGEAAHAEHDDQDGHEHGEGEGAEEGEGAKVGPEKGVTEANEKFGFKLSPEAEKNFELKSLKLSGVGPWQIPKSAVVRSEDETNLFRVRNGFFKRVDFKVLKKDERNLIVDSDDMRENDMIVVSGIGFLRIAELSAFGGLSSGHSH